jgi:DNA-binding GntR family transcriptional regulator
MVKPKYQQIAEDLRAQIDSGSLRRGSQLPTEADLRDRYGASRNTVRDAIRRLTDEGLVKTRPGTVFPADRNQFIVNVGHAPDPRNVGPRETN